MSSGNSKRSVLVVGAGTAGLAAALRLAERGCSVTMLEANDRVGGRIRTVQANGAVIELGAEFIHGRPPELLSLVQELGLHSTEREGEMVYYGDGTLAVETGDDTDGPLPVMERLRRWSEAHPEQDMSFATWVAPQQLSAHEMHRATGYVEGFNAADAEEISVRSLAVQQEAEDAMGGESASHVDGGYAQLPERLAARFQAAGGHLYLRAHVVALEWKQGSVTAVLAGGERHTAECAVVTLPLGVLRAGSVRFSPEPGMVLQHAARMRMGDVCRMSLVFRRRWWAELGPAKFDSSTTDALARLSFLLPSERSGRAEQAHFDVFWSPFPSREPVLTAWSGGPAAAAFSSLDDHAIAHTACADLARIFGLSQEDVLNELLAHHHHDWTRDPLFCGAYSWVAVGGVSASASMCEPVEGTLFFAGEHTDTTGNWGTVHGAYRSGLRAAQQVLAQHQAVAY